jgi:hypothetical protein
MVPECGTKDYMFLLMKRMVYIPLFFLNVCIYISIVGKIIVRTESVNGVQI